MRHITLAFVVAASSVQSFGQHNSVSEVEQHLEDLLLKRVIMDDALLDSTESAWRNLALSTVRCEDDCAACNKLRNSILFAGCSGLNAKHFESALQSVESGICEVEFPASDFMLGNIYYTRREFQKAYDRYIRIPESDDDEFGLMKYVLAQQNASAVKNNMNEPEVAIDILKGLLDFLSRHDDREIIDANLKRTLKINLAALMLTVHDVNQAIDLLNAVNQDSLDTYWAHIRNLNLLVAYHQSNDFDLSHEHWVSNIRNGEDLFLNSPYSAHESIVSQCLLSEDLDVFLALYAAFTPDITSPLHAEESQYHALFIPSQDEATLLENWEQHVRWEKKYLTYRKSKMDQLSARHDLQLNQIQNELDELTGSYSLLQQLDLLAVVLVFLSLSAFLIVRKKRVRRNKRDLEIAIEPELDLAHSKDEHPIELELDDLRTIGDALVSGRNVSEALLVLKKIRSGMFQKGDILDFDLSIIPESTLLNESEKRIYLYLLSGFSSKEIARMLRITPQHVYNSRSSIRNKLEVPRDVDLVLWTIDKYPAIQVDEN